MGLLIVGSSWPIIWFGFDQVHASLVNAQSDAFGAKCLELLITLFKGLAPVSFASLAVKSPAGRAISQAASGAITIAKWTGGVALGCATSVIPMNRSSKSSYFERNRKHNSNRSDVRGWSGGNTDRLRKARQQLSSKGFKKNENPQ